MGFSGPFVKPTLAGLLIYPKSWHAICYYKGVTNKYEEYVPDETYDKPVTGEALYTYVNIYYKSTNSDAYDHNPNESYEPCVRIGVGRDDEKTFEFMKELCEKYPADY